MHIAAYIVNGTQSDHPLTPRDMMTSSQRDHTQLYVLTLDDDEAIRGLLTDIILPLGHQVIPVASAEEALAQLPFFTFHVAFLDHNLPGMEGLVFGDYLRRNNPEMNIALITADPDPTLERRTLEHNICLIRKPFRVGDIQDVLDRATTRILAAEDAVEQCEKPNYDPILRPAQNAPLASYGLPSPPQRLEEALVQTIKSTLHTLRSSQVLDNATRDACYCALVTALTLDIKLPSIGDHASPFEAYDALMTENGLHRAFSPEPSLSNEPL